VIEICLKCGYSRTEADKSLDADQCPSCGRFYAKMEAALNKSVAVDLPKAFVVHDNANNLKWIAGGFIIILLVSALSHHRANKPSDSVQAAPVEISQPEPIKAVQPIKTISLGMTPEMFRQDFNRTVTPINARYTLSEFSIKQGEVFNVFNQMLSSGLGLVSTVNKDDGTMRDFIVMLGGGNNDSLEAVVVILASAQIFNSSIPKEQNNKVIMEMIDVLNKTKSPKEERIVGDLKYTAMANNGMGLWFSFSHK